jgi:hypothetical protein
MEDSIVSHNSAAGAAGGIDNYGDAELTRSTVQSNIEFISIYGMICLR